jgi:prepilin-type N-terminal cleavage/methylation domain-containing protein
MLKQLRKESGFTIIELLIVIAIIGILATLVLTNFQGAQAKGRDTVRKSDMNSIYQKLEEYYNENGGYPDGALDDTVLAGIDTGALTDEDGDAIQYTGGFILGTTAPTTAADNDNEYYYLAYDCSTAGAQSPVGATCNKYVVTSYQETTASNAPYTKTSLN